MTAVDRARRTSIDTSEVRLEAPRSTRPVLVWAALGAIFLAIEVYALTTWIVSGDATPTPDGPTPIPTWMQVVAHGLEAVSLTAFVAMFWFVIVRPWRREGRLSNDGLLGLVFALIWWQDPMLNYFQSWFTYNTVFVNFGSWTRHMPGWLAPNGNQLAEPILFGPPAYLWVIFGGALVGSAFLGRVRRRWPNLGATGLVMSCVGFFVVFDFVVESTFMRLGLYAYGGSPKPFTLFAGHYYQFPVHEKLSWAITWAAWACLRFFRDDRGLTVAERGLDRMRLGGRKRTMVRFLALSGACNLIWFVFYNVPMAIFGLYASPWPDDIANRSYLTDNLCGAATTYACSGPGIPIPRPDSVHVGPDGRLQPRG